MTPLSIWDLPVEGGLLWERLGVPRVDALRQRGASETDVGAELAATAVTAIRSLRERHGFASAYVAGGLTQIAGFAAALSNERDVVVDAEGRFVGERGGLALLAQHGHADGVVADVGQTGIKLSSGGHRLVVERDSTALPFEFIDPSGAPSRVSSTRLGAAAAFIGGALARVGGATGLVLALPCPLDDGCVPGPCTYGWEGEAGLVPAILEKSGGSFREVLVLNDAELAAETALARGGARCPVLVMTVGFGPGGAMVVSYSMNTG